MEEKQLVRWAEAVLSRLAVPVTVQAATDCREDDAPCEHGGRLVLDLKRQGLRLSCDASAPGGRDILTLAAALVSPRETEERQGMSPAQVCRLAMLGQLSAEELQRQARMLRLNSGRRQCLFVFRRLKPETGRVCELLQPVLPLEERDTLVEVDR